MTAIVPKTPKKLQAIKNIPNTVIDSIGIMHVYFVPPSMSFLWGGNVATQFVVGENGVVRDRTCVKYLSHRFTFLHVHNVCVAYVR